LDNIPEAASSLPFTINQRGLSGMKKITMKNSMAGMVSAPSIPRHTSVANILSSTGLSDENTIDTFSR